jgi:hypothetical protein
MRDALALALVRAEHCRVYASEHTRRDETTTKIRGRALVARAWRSFRATRRDAKSSHAERAVTGATVPSD